MNEYRIAHLLQLKSGEVPERTQLCPDDECIAEYFEGTLGDQKRIALRRHLVDCGFCMARVGNLQRLADDSEASQVPGTILADAKTLVKPSLPARSWRSPAWAAAALVVLTITAISMLRITPGRIPGVSTTDVQSVSSLPRQLRSLEPAALKPAIISPLDGASIATGELEIRWTGVPGSLHYDVLVVNAEGFIIHRDRVEDATEWKPLSSHLLEAGSTYYVRVDAYLAEANSVSSDHILFTVAEPRQ